VRRAISDQAITRAITFWLAKAEYDDGDMRQIVVCSGFLFAKVRQTIQQFIVEKLIHLDEQTPGNFAVERPRI
jgi:hypothetical protein